MGPTQLSLGRATVSNQPYGQQGCVATASPVDTRAMARAATRSSYGQMQNSYGTQSAPQGYGLAGGYGSSKFSGVLEATVFAPWLWPAASS